MSRATTTQSTYSFKLQNSIEQEADSALSRLDDIIRTKGYEWLDDYMQGVNEAVARGGRKNAAQAGSALVNILKTPSRTPRLGTAKKTRTVLAKEKNKESKLRLANADLKNEKEESSRKVEAARAPNVKSSLLAPAGGEGRSDIKGAKPTMRPHPISVKDASNPFVESIIEPNTASAPVRSSKIESDVTPAHHGNVSSQDQVRPSKSQASQKRQVKSKGDEYEVQVRLVTHQEPAVAHMLHPEPPIPNTPVGSGQVGQSNLASFADDELPENVDFKMGDSKSLSPAIVFRIEGDNNGNSDVGRLTDATQPMRLENPATVSITLAEGPEAAADEQAKAAAKTPPYITQQTDEIDTEDLGASCEPCNGPESKTAPTADYSVPLKDDDASLIHPTSPNAISGTTSKSPFSPSAVTFAALPTRDLPRGRSIGATKHQRMTSHLMESIVPEVQTVKTPGPTAAVLYQLSNENAPAVSKASRDSKSGGTGAGSSWISRKVLGGSGAEELRKSLAVSKRPSTIEGSREDESDHEADEVEEMAKRGNTRASEATMGPQRFSLATKTPQHLSHARQTLGTSTISRPAINSITTPFVDQPQSNLSKMIADLQEKRAVASFNASVTRATLPSLQLGRGAQGIATMGISSGLLGRSVMQSSLDRTKAQSNQAAVHPESPFNDDERPKDLVKLSDLEDPAPKDAQAVAPAQPSTTEELNQAVDEILRKISTERQLAQVHQLQPDMAAATKDATEDMEEDRAVQTLSLSVAQLQVKTPASAGPKDTSGTASMRAEEQEVEELTKRTHTLSINSRERVRRDSESLTMPGGHAASTAFLNRTEKVSSARQSSLKEETPPRSDHIPMSTTPVNTPPRSILYRPSHAHVLPPSKSKPVRPSATQNSEASRERERPQPVGVLPSTAMLEPKPSPAKIRERIGTSQQEKLEDSQNGLSRSQAVTIDEDGSDSSFNDSDLEEVKGDRRFNEKEVLADEVAKLAKPLDLSDRSKITVEDIEASDSDAESVIEVGSNGSNSRAPSRNGGMCLASSTTTNALSASTTGQSTAKAYLHTPANIARLIDGQKAPAGPINSILKAQQRKAEEEVRKAKRIANKEAIEKRKQDERQAKLDEIRSKEEADKKARLERLRKQKAERERLEKKRQEQEASRATDTFTKDRATSIEPNGPKTGLNQSLGPKRMLTLTKTPKSAETAKGKESTVCGGPLKGSTTRPPSRVSALPTEIKGGVGAMRPPMPRTNTNPSAVAFQPSTTSNLLPVNTAREMNPRASTLAKQPPPLTTSMNANNSDVRAVRPNKKPSIIPSQKAGASRQRDSTMKPTRETLKPGMNVVEFQRMIALGGKTPANMRSEDIELSDIGSDFGYESDSSESDKGEVIPAWAQSPALKKAAALQEKINPSHLFGIMPEFKMETVFDTKAARRPRSSSANWTGQDRLTEQEKLEYTKKMGYRSIDDLALIAMNMGTNP